MTKPSLFLLTLVTLSLFLPSNVLAQQRCYELVNNTTITVRIDFRYPEGVLLGDHVTRLDIMPSGHYTTCFDPGTTGTALVYGAMWAGSTPCTATSGLIMGFSTLASRPGTWAIQSQPNECHGEPNGSRATGSALIPTAVYTLRASGMCIGFERGSASRVALSNCDTDQQRLFTVSHAGLSEGKHFIRDGDVSSHQAGMCLDSASEDPTEVIHFVPCDRRNYQLWTFAPADGGGYNIVNEENGRCLDAGSAAGRQAGSEARTWECNGGSDQRWTLTRVRDQ
jgi:hypothetical protein